jgi:hypothetical protein
MKRLALFALVVSVMLTTSEVYLVAGNPLGAKDNSTPDVLPDSTTTSISPTSPAPDSASAVNTSTAPENSSLAPAPSITRHSMEDILATIEIQMPNHNGIYAGVFPLDVNIEYYTYRCTDERVAIPFQTYSCIYSVDNGGWKAASLLPNASQGWCVSLANGGGYTEVFCNYHADLQGLSEGLHLINVTVAPNEVWSHDAHIGDTDSSMYFAVHGRDVFCCRLEFPENVTGGNPDVFLKPVLNAPFSWMAYSLDGKANVTIAGETQMPGVSSGCHFVTVYANDTEGIMTRSKTVFFSVE